MVLIIFLSVVLILGVLFVEHLADKKYLNSKQYRFYCVVLFIGFLVVCGLIDSYCKTLNGF